jgi:hypothetical protein
MGDFESLKLEIRLCAIGDSAVGGAAGNLESGTESGSASVFQTRRMVGRR